MDWWPLWLPKTVFGVGTEVVATTLGSSVVFAAFIGWVTQITRSRFLQSIVAAIILSPGTAIFSMVQFGLGPHWAWAIGFIVGVVALPLMMAAARRAPTAVDTAIMVGVDVARGMIEKGAKSVADAVAKDKGKADD